MLLFTILCWGMKRYRCKIVPTDSVVTPFWTVVLTEMHREFTLFRLLWMVAIPWNCDRFCLRALCLCCLQNSYAVRVEQCSGAVHSHWLPAVCSGRGASDGKAWLKSEIRLWRNLRAFWAAGENVSTSRDAVRDGLAYLSERKFLVVICVLADAHLQTCQGFCTGGRNCPRS